MTPPTCETCPYWLGDRESSARLGDCRRHSPSLEAKPTLTRHTYWCGEHADFLGYLNERRAAALGAALAAEASRLKPT